MGRVMPIKIENHPNYTPSNRTLPSFEPYIREVQTIIEALKYFHSWGSSHAVDSDWLYSFAMNKISWLLCRLWNL